MFSNDTSDHIHLMIVFRKGLIDGLVFPEDIIAWADQMIKHQELPYDFFIELAMCNTVNSIITKLDEVNTGAGSIISDRVILALLYQKLLEGEIDASKLNSIICGIDRKKHLLPEEDCRLLSMMLDYDDITDTMGDDEPRLPLFISNAIEKLSIYKDLSLSNCSAWNEISHQISVNI